MSKSPMEKFDDGDRLTDKELDGLIDQLDALCDRLLTLRYPPYRLMQKDALHKLQQLHSYRDARWSRKAD